MKYFLLITLLAAQNFVSNGQILPSSQRQKILDKEDANHYKVKQHTVVTTVYTPEKTSCNNPVFKTRHINLLNEYKDSVIVNILWPDKTTESHTLKTGVVIQLKNKPCKSLIFFKDKQHFCTKDLNPDGRYCVTWDAKTNCYCLTDYK